MINIYNYIALRPMNSIIGYDDNNLIMLSEQHFKTLKDICFGGSFYNIENYLHDRYNCQYMKLLFNDATWLLEWSNEQQAFVWKSTEL